MTTGNQPALCDGGGSATSATLHHRAEQLQRAFTTVATLDDWRQLDLELDAFYGELADRVGHDDDTQEPGGFAPWSQGVGLAVSAYYSARGARATARARIGTPEVTVYAIRGPDGEWQATHGDTVWARRRRLEDIVQLVRTDYPSAVIRATVPAATAYHGAGQSPG